MKSLAVNSGSIQAMGRQYHAGVQPNTFPGPTGDRQLFENYYRGTLVPPESLQCNNTYGVPADESYWPQYAQPREIVRQSQAGTIDPYTSLRNQETHNFNTNLFRPAVLPTPPLPISKHMGNISNTWMLSQMSSFQSIDQGHSELEDHGYSLRGGSSFDCPSLTSEDGGNSPTSISSWIPFTPSSTFEDTMTVQQPKEHLAMRYFSNNQTPQAFPSQTQQPDAFAPSTVLHTGLTAPSTPFTYGSWHWLTDQQRAADNHASNSMALHAHAIPLQYESNSSTDMFPLFDSRLASAQMSSMGYTQPAELTVKQDKQVVPGLLCSSVMDEHALTRTTSRASTISNDTCDAGYDTPPSALEEIPMLPSQASSQEQYLFETPFPCGAPPIEASRTDRDLFLLQSRRSGLSYKEIKRRGGFTEAESTLRGRIRILLKPKHERVRKPQWHQNDIMLLHRAVRLFAKTSGDVVRSNGQSTRTGRLGHVASKPPWKKISEWMKDNGASYPFAPATCAKKWEHIQEMLG